MPPLLANAFNTSFDLLRRAGCQKVGLAWVMTVGRSDISMASRVERVAEWLVSTTMPIRFISRIT